ncbi:MAG TPA: hypothetical protein PK324_12560 [Nocardioides sp.]|nr:hypothetical protein [Nocardioides sp.]
MLVLDGGNLRTRITGDTAPIRLTYTDATGAAIDITGYESTLTVDPNENPADASTNLFAVSGAIADASAGLFEYTLTEEQADLLVPLAGNAAYWAWITVIDADGATETVKMRLPVAGGPGARVLSITGAGGVELSAGQVVTGEANIRAIVISNGEIKVTHGTPSIPGAETLAHYLWAVDESGAYTRVMSAQYGDWTYPVVGATVPYNRATVRQATQDAIEVAFQVDAYSLSSAFGGLGVRRRDDANEALDYPINSSTAKSDTVVAFVKTIRVERGVPGYFVGYSFYPDILPGNSHVPSYNDVPDYGEIEIGPGSDVAVAFSMVAGSLIATARHPAFGSDARWAAAEAAVGNIADHAANMGIYDPDGTYQPTYWANATVRATQHALFPYRPTTGPWAVAAINASPSIPYCVYMVLRYPMLVQSAQVSDGSNGYLRILYYRKKHATNGHPFRFPVFIGVTPHVADPSSGYANEPSPGLQSTIAAAASGVDWPEP